VIQRPANYTPAYTADPVMIAAGKKIFENTSLSSNGMSCATCHTAGEGYQNTFAQPFPHFVQMAKSVYGLDQVHLDEAVQMCMANPMATEPFAWDDKDLQNLAAYVQSEQIKFANK
jgi:cytochrome c peroxidase